MKKLTLYSLLFALASSPLSSAVAEETKDTTKSITIYSSATDGSGYNRYYGGNSQNSGYAVINRNRLVEFDKGLNFVTVDDLPETVEVETIYLGGLSDSKNIIERVFSSNKINSTKILEDNIGNQVEVEQKSGDRTNYYRGKLISLAPQLVIEEDERYRVINGYSSIMTETEDKKAQDKKGNYITWNVFSNNADDELVEYNFTTKGISWSADYNLFVEEDKKGELSAQLEGWSNINNTTNIEAKSVELKLVAGSPNKQNRNQPQTMMAKSYSRAPMAEMAMDDAGAGASMNQENFSDYYMYTINRKVDVDGETSKKIKLFDDKKQIPIERKYSLNINQFNNFEKALVELSFKNDDTSGLGIALPAGIYRVYQRDNSGAFQVSGETSQGHKSHKDKVKLNIGKAFDIKGKKEKLDYKYDSTRRRADYKIKLTLQNSKEVTETVYVKEMIHDQNWKISKSSEPYKKINANEVEFKIKIKPKSKAFIEYSVESSW